MATLDVYEEEGLFERARHLEPVLEETLHALADKPNVIAMCATSALPAPIELAPSGRRSRRKGQRRFRCGVRTGECWSGPPGISSPWRRRW